MKWGNLLRSSAKDGRLPIDEELQLFLADRRDHVNRCIAPSLKEGNIVILDRYYWSNAAYQGSRGADFERIVALNEEFAPKPDLVLVLDLDVDCGLERIRNRGDKPNLFESKHSLMHARRIFLQLDEKSPNCRVIETGGDIKHSFGAALIAFQLAAIEKIAKSGELHPDMVNRTLKFFGDEPIQAGHLQGSPEMNALVAEAIGLPR